jgi:hypothetical protein
MEKIIRILAISLVAILNSLGVLVAQESNLKIWSCSQPIKIIRGGSQVLKTPKQAKGFTLTIHDEIVTAKEVVIELENNATVHLPSWNHIKVEEMLTSSYYSQERDSYWRTALKISGFFINNNEDNNTYFNRIAEKGGKRITRGALEADILKSSTLMDTVSANDVELLRGLVDSLHQHKVRDSIVYYLESAMFYEQKDYLRMACDNYKNAYDYAQKHKVKAPTVTNVYRQFLLRVGQFDAADKVK